MRIGVLADTHIPDRTDELPAEIFDYFRGVDLILHAGDVCEQVALDWLGTLAPVIAVRGNCDLDALPNLPEKTIISAGPWRIGLIHGHRSRLVETGDRYRYMRGDHKFADLRRYVRHAFDDQGGTVPNSADNGNDPPPVHCIVFGHTHQVCQEMAGGVLLFNPGGVPRSLGGGPCRVGLLEISAAGIEARLILLQHPPRTYSARELVDRSLARRHT